MENKSSPATQAIHPASLSKCMRQGALIALALLSVFLYLDEATWPRTIRPLLVMPAAGAIGGIFYYFMDHLRYQGGWLKTLAAILSLIVYGMVLWLGAVLGLNGNLIH